MLKNVLPIFSSRIFMVTCLLFKFLSHFEFIFVYSVRVCANFIDLKLGCPTFSIPLAEETVFSPLHILASFVKD